MQDTQARKWQLTINNPVEKGYTHDRIKEILSEFSAMKYWCMSDEIGENGTFHTHIYFYLDSASRFSTVKNRFPEAHIEMANGTSLENRDYVFKQGKWLDDKKKETNIEDSHEEYGECPLERPGKRSDLTNLYEMIREGKSNFEIIEENPKYMLHLDRIERTRQTILESEFKNTFRKMRVEYVCGVTGAGKTRGVMEKYGYDKVFRVTDYSHPWDGYRGQDVVVFEEFKSSLRIQDMLNYLDGYPLELPSRYVNKIACYTKVFILSNVLLEDQYRFVQQDDPGVWDAFLRRVHCVRLYSRSGVDVYTVPEYMHGPVDVTGVISEPEVFQQKFSEVI